MAETVTTSLTSSTMFDANYSGMKLELSLREKLSPEISSGYKSSLAPV